MIIAIYVLFIDLLTSRKRKKIYF